MATYTQSEVDEAIRKTLYPSIYSSFLSVLSPYTTPIITANTPTRVLIPTTQKFNRDFVVKEISGQSGVFAVHYIGVATRRFIMNASFGEQAGTNNLVVRIEAYKNLSPESGMAVPRKLGTGADVGAVPLSGTFELSTEDYISVYVETSLTASVTFSDVSINIYEV